MDLKKAASNLIDKPSYSLTFDKITPETKVKTFTPKATKKASVEKLIFCSDV